MITKYQFKLLFDYPKETNYKPNIRFHNKFCDLHKNLINIPNFNNLLYKYTYPSNYDETILQTLTILNIKTYPWLFKFFYLLEKYKLIYFLESENKLIGITIDNFIYPLITFRNKTLFIEDMEFKILIDNNQLIECNIYYKNELLNKNYFLNNNIYFAEKQTLTYKLNSIIPLKHIESYGYHTIKKTKNNS